jgi:hypothetical protein
MSLTFNEWTIVEGCGTVALNLLTFNEALPIVTHNIVPAVSFMPVGGLFMLDVNGQTFTTADGSFMLNGNVVSWVSPIYSINPGDTVVAIYSYMG